MQKITKGIPLPLALRRVEEGKVKKSKFELIYSGFRKLWLVRKEEGKNAC